MGNTCTKVDRDDANVYYIVIKDIKKGNSFEEFNYIPRTFLINERLIGNNNHCYGCNTKNHTQVKSIDLNHWFEIPNEYIKLI